MAFEIEKEDEKEENLFEENEITNDEYFEEFNEDKENFERIETKELEKEEDLFIDDSKPKIINSSEKKELSSTIVNMFTEVVNDLASALTGTTEKRRYMPSNESKKEMKKALAVLLPDTIGKTPPWVQITIIVGMAYFPIAMKAKEDLKIKRIQENLDNENNKNEETKIVNFSKKEYETDKKERENNETDNNSGA